MNDLLDERRAPLADAAIAEHAAVCSACASIARGYETLSEGVSAWERVEVSADLTDRVIAQWELAKAQSLASATLANSPDWDSAELPALRPVGLQWAMPTAARSGGFWSAQRELILAGAVLATAAALLVISGVGRTHNADNGGAIANAPVVQQGAGLVALNPAEETTSDETGNASLVRPAPQFTLTSLPIVEQMTESYRPLLEETDRTVRKSLGLPLTSENQLITSAAAMGLVTQADPEASDTWDSLVPDPMAQVAPVTQSAVRSVVALLRVLPGIEQPLNQ